MSNRPFPKPIVMTPLEQRVVALGVCPRCHRKTLKAIEVPATDLKFCQCRDCLHLYLMPEAA